MRLLRLSIRYGALLALPLVLLTPHAVAAQDRPRPRALGVAPGVLPTGPLNAITDVPGVLVGQTTVIRGDSIRTGVTAILPHGGNLYRETAASGQPIPGIDGDPGFGKIEQGFLETSNVDPVKEITDLIAAQRAYEMNSKVIQAADEMAGVVSKGIR